MNNTVINGKYYIRNKIGEGSFGSVYDGYNTHSYEKVAIKVEECGKSVRRQLYNEYKIYKELCKSKLFPNIYWYGKHKNKNVLIMDLLGNNLEELFEMCDRYFSMYTILYIAVQSVNLLKIFHKTNYIHRDIKPNNFVINNENNNIYLIDYGLAKRYRNKNNIHIKFKDNIKFVGTVRYASGNVHIGLESSRRDDLESLLYVLIYFTKGRLPWQGIKASTKSEKYRKIGNLKLKTSSTKLLNNLPRCFMSFYTYCRSLEFGDTPDYDYLIKIFNKELLKQSEDDLLDWIKHKKVNTDPSTSSSIDSVNDIITQDSTHSYNTV